MTRKRSRKPQTRRRERNPAAQLIRHLDLLRARRADDVCRVCGANRAHHYAVLDHTFAKDPDLS